MIMRITRHAAIVAVAMLGLSSSAISAPKLQIDSQDALDAALAKAKGGETLALAPGVYSITLLDRTFPATLTITSADPSRPARISWHKLSNVSKVTFTRLDMGRAVKPGGYPDAENVGKVTGGSDITFDDVHVYGSLDNDATNDITGLQISALKNARVINSEFEQLARAIQFGAIDGLVVANNRIHNIRSDGFNLAACSHVLIEGNHFTGSQRAKRDHPDAIQFWTVNTKRPSTDIVIRDNEIIQGKGSGTQGVFMTDYKNGGLRYERVTIENNIIIGSNMANGILIADAKDVKILNNTVISPADDGNPIWIKTVRVENLTLQDNIADVGGNKTPDRAKINMALLKTKNLPNLRASDVVVPGIGYQPKR